jgi:hypothetical protein
MAGKRKKEVFMKDMVFGSAGMALMRHRVTVAASKETRLPFQAMYIPGIRKLANTGPINP